MIAKLSLAYLAVAAVCYWLDLGGPAPGEPPRPTWRRVVRAAAWLPLAVVGRL